MFKQALNGRFIVSIKQKNKLLTRPFFSGLTIIFNKVKEVGPDRACAEWLLRNGAFIRWKNSLEYLTNYDVLIATKGPCYIQAVKSIDSSIHYTGFPHFAGCKHIEKVRLIRSHDICNRALSLLSYLKESLCHLEVIGCGNVTDEGLRSLKKLKNLKILKLGGMPYLKDPEGIKRELIEYFPDAQIEFK